MLKIILNVFLIILVALFQTSFLNSLSEGLVLINLPLAIIILLVFFRSIKWALVWTLGQGLLLDFFSFFHRGQSTLSLLLVFLVVYLLLTYVFTHRSLYSLVFLGVLGTAIYELSIFLFSRLFYSLKLINYEVIFSDIYFKQISEQLLYSFVIFALIFLLLFIFFKKRLIKFSN